MLMFSFFDIKFTHNISIYQNVKFLSREEWDKLLLSSQILTKGMNEIE